MGYFSELDMTAAKTTAENADLSRLDRLESWLGYLEDKLESLECAKPFSRRFEDLFPDSLPGYEYDEPDTVSGLYKAINGIKSKISEEYGKNAKMLEWRLSVLLNGETPEGQLAFTDMFAFSADAA